MSWFKNWGEAAKLRSELENKDQELEELKKVNAALQERNDVLQAVERVCIPKRSEGGWENNYEEQLQNILSSGVVDSFEIFKSVNYQIGTISGKELAFRDLESTPFKAGRFTNIVFGADGSICEASGRFRLADEQFPGLFTFVRFTPEGQISYFEGQCETTNNSILGVNGRLNKIAFYDNGEIEYIMGSFQLNNENIRGKLTYAMFFNDGKSKMLAGRFTINDQRFSGELSRAYFSKDGSLSKIEGEINLEQVLFPATNGKFSCIRFNEEGKIKEAEGIFEYQDELIEAEALKKVSNSPSFLAIAQEGKYIKLLQSDPRFRSRSITDIKFDNQNKVTQVKGDEIKAEFKGQIYTAKKIDFDSNSATLHNVSTNIEQKGFRATSADKLSFDEEGNLRRIVSQNIQIHDHPILKSEEYTSAEFDKNGNIVEVNGENILFQDPGKYEGVDFDIKNPTVYELVQFDSEGAVIFTRDKEGRELNHPIDIIGEIEAREEELDQQLRVIGRGVEYFSKLKDQQRPQRERILYLKQIHNLK